MNFDDIIELPPKKIVKELISSAKDKTYLYEGDWLYASYSQQELKIAYLILLKAIFQCDINFDINNLIRDADLIYHSLGDDIIREIDKTF
jgi:hypothetical protein